jgi:hypothetical protein
MGKQHLDFLPPATGLHVFWSGGTRAHQPLCHAALNDALEHITQEIALSEAAVAVLGKRRMIGDVAIEPQSTEME